MVLHESSGAPEDLRKPFPKGSVWMVFHEFKGKMAKCLEETPFGYWMTKCSRLWKPLSWAEGEVGRILGTGGSRTLVLLLPSPRCPPLTMAGHRIVGQKGPCLEWPWPPCHLIGGFQEQNAASEWWLTGSEKSPLAEVLPLQTTNYCISMLNDLGGFGATLLPSCVDPWQHEVLCWWLIWMDCLIGGSNLWV